MDGDSGHILLVEDDGDIRKLVGDQLVRMGYRVSPAACARECMEALRRPQDPPDLVLLDRYLPDGDGFDIIKRIRSDKETSRVPVVVISVEQNAESVSQMLAAGAVDYLVKPFEAKVLGARVAAAIREARQKETQVKTLNLLARIKKELQLTFDAVGEALILINRDLSVRRINRAGMVMAGELAFDRVLGRKCHDVLYGRDEPCSDCPVQDAFRERRSQEREAVREVRGRRVNHRYRVQFLEAPEGGGEMAIVAVEDVTIRRRSQEEHRRAERLQTVMRLAGGLAHEISQPLATVSGRAELLEMALGDAEKAPDRADLARHVGGLRENIRRISEIVHRLQNVSEYVTKPYYGDTEILDLDRSSGSGDAARAAEDGAEYPHDKEGGDRGTDPGSSQA